MLLNQVDNHVPLSAVGGGALEQEGEQPAVRLLPGDPLGRLHDRVDEVVAPLDLFRERRTVAN